MKNLLKKYFLFFSQGPFTFSAIIFTIAAIAMAISFSLNEVATTVILDKYGFIILGVIFVNMCLVYFIRGKYITTCNNDDDYEGALFSVLVTKEGEKIILTKPIWKIGKKYDITSDNYHSLSIYEDNGKGQTKTVCYISGKYKNSLVKIPVTLTLKYNGTFNRLELFDLLIKNFPNSKPLSLDNYLKKSL